MTESELLQYALAQGMIDVGTLKAQIEMNERKRFIEMHKNKVWQGKNGKWYTELPATKDKPRRLVKKSKQEDLEEEIINFYRTEEEHPTVRQVYEEWIQTKQDWEEISRSTVDRYNLDFKRYFEDTDLPAMRVDFVTEDYLENLIKNNIASKELTAKAYSNMKTLLIGVLKYAKKRKYTNFSASVFFGDIQLSKKTFKQPEKKKQVFTQDEAKKIKAWLYNNPSLKNYGILLAFQTGVREGELAALKFADIENGFMHVQRQEIRHKGEQPGEVVHKIVEFTKTAAGDRFIVMTDEALEIIKALRRLNPFSEYIFRNTEFTIHKERFNDSLYIACQHCGIQQMSMHKIRKTYGTTLLDGGADDSTIMEQMGHSDITTTRKFYYASNKDRDERAEQVKRALML